MARRKVKAAWDATRAYDMLSMHMQFMRIQLCEALLEVQAVGVELERTRQQIAGLRASLTSEEEPTRGLEKSDDRRYCTLVDHSSMETLI